MTDEIRYNNCNILLKFLYKQDEFIRPNEISEKFSKKPPSEISDKFDLLGTISFMYELLDKERIQGVSTNIWRYKLKTWAKTEMNYLNDKYKERPVDYFVEIGYLPSLGRGNLTQANKRKQKITLATLLTPMWKIVSGNAIISGIIATIIAAFILRKCFGI